MISGTVFNQLVSTLKNNPTLSGYIRQVHKGFRFNMESDAYPYISVELVSDSEIEQDLNQYKKIWLGADIYAFSYCPSDSDKTIIGDANYKGIMDISQDIRACLQSSYTLGDNVIDTRFDKIEFFVEEAVRSYAVRSCRIPVKFLYQQNNNI